ncbi:MAG: DNA primase [Gammaproteobacteria bacterium]|nr:DNA primase [Gammaproteobacteria bacterium]
MSGRIPQDFIDELLARVDIVEVLGTRLQLKKAGREYKALCPFHTEKTPSFTLSPDKGFYHCFGCGAHGTALGFLMEHDRLPFVEAVEELASLVGMNVPREDSPAARQQRSHHELLAQAAQLYRELLKNAANAVDYLKRRGIDGPTAARYQLGFAPDAWDTVMKRMGGTPELDAELLLVGLLTENERHRRYDRFRDRIMFPIRDLRGRMVGFGGRVLGEGEPKYLNSPETPVFHKGRELYGLYEARQALREIPRLLVVEGYMDVIGLARHGIAYAVATLGTATTAEQVARLFRVTDEVVFCFDGDRAGRAAAWRALENALPEAREGRQIAFLFLPEGEDPDSLVAREGANAFEARLTEAVPMSDFLVERLSRDIDMRSVDGRARLAELARPLLAKIAPGVYRELLLERLAESVGLGAARLGALLEPARQSDATPQRVTQRRARSPERGGRATLVRQALLRLLHFPQLALHGPDPAFLAGLDRPGAELLRGIIADVRARPQMNSAMLLERWREHPEGRHLGRLLDTELLVDEQAAQGEYTDIIARLEAQARRARVDALREKGGALTEEEKHEFRRLLATRSDR